MKDKNKKIDTSIKPIKIQHDLTDFKPLKSPFFDKYIIPNHPSRVLYTGKTSSGKSTTLINILQFYKYYFNGGIYIFSPTSDIDPSWKNWINQNENVEEIQIFDNLEIDALKEILEESKDQVEKDGLRDSPRRLIIIDDLIDSKNIKNPVMKTLFYKSRHYNISVWITSQSYMNLPRDLRLQLSNIFIHKPDNSEIKRLSDEQSNIYIDNKGLNELIKMVCFDKEDKYSFLHINKQDQPNQWIRKNLNKFFIL
jgi:hypothetical protein